MRDHEKPTAPFIQTVAHGFRVWAELLFLAFPLLAAPVAVIAYRAGWAMKDAGANNPYRDVRVLATFMASDSALFFAGVFVFIKFCFENKTKGKLYDWVKDKWRLIMLKLRFKLACLVFFFAIAAAALGFTGAYYATDPKLNGPQLLLKPQNDKVWWLELSNLALLLFAVVVTFGYFCYQLGARIRVRDEITELEAKLGKVKRGDESYGG